MIHYKSTSRLSSFVLATLMSLALSLPSFASGSYSPPKRRSINTAKVELYHLGKRLITKRIAPTGMPQPPQEVLVDQGRILRNLVEKVRLKNLKTLQLEHLNTLSAREFDAVVIYLTTRYGVRP